MPFETTAINTDFNYSPLLNCYDDKNGYDKKYRNTKIATNIQAKKRKYLTVSDIILDS